MTKAISDLLFRLSLSIGSPLEFCCPRKLKAVAIKTGLLPLTLAFHTAYYYTFPPCTLITQKHV